MDEQEGIERLLSRGQLLKVATAAGGASLLGGKLGSAQAALDWLSLSSETAGCRCSTGPGTATTGAKRCSPST